MDDHKIEVSELLQRLKSGEDTGISTVEAQNRQKEFGMNKLPEGKRVPPWLLFLKELTNWFAIMLWVGSALCILGYFL